jgi:hypothetical protein
MGADTRQQQRAEADRREVNPPMADENGQLNWSEVTAFYREGSHGQGLAGDECAVDGYVAGPDISPEMPLGRDGERLHEWMFPGRSSAESQRFETDHFRGIGALILGRRMTDLGIGPWGEEPTFHAPALS